MQLSAFSKIDCEVCEKLWQQLVEIIQQRMLFGHKTIMAHVGCWSTEQEPDFIAILPSSERFLVPPRIVVRIDYVPHSDHQDQLKTLLKATTSVVPDTLDAFYSAIGALFLMHQNKQHRLMWSGLGLFEPFERPEGTIAYTFVPEDSFACQVNKPFELFSPTLLNKESEWPALKKVKTTVLEEVYPVVRSWRTSFLSTKELNERIPTSTEEPQKDWDVKNSESAEIDSGEKMFQGNSNSPISFILNNEGEAVPTTQNSSQSSLLDGELQVPKEEKLRGRIEEEADVTKEESTDSLQRLDNTVFPVRETEVPIEQPMQKRFSMGENSQYDDKKNGKHPLRNNKSKDQRRKRRSLPRRIFFVMLIVGLLALLPVLYWWLSVNGTLLSIKKESSDRNLPQPTIIFNEERPLYVPSHPLEQSIDSVVSLFETKQEEQKVLSEAEEPDVEKRRVVPPNEQVAKKPSAAESKPLQRQEQKPCFVVTKKGRTLSSYAREHLGHNNFWVYIYLVNRKVIANPNIVPEGKKLRLPTLDEYPMNPNRAQDLEQARELCKRYLRS